MEKRFVRKDSVISTSNVWVPQGLLRSVSNKVYDNTHRRSVQDLTEKVGIEDIIAQPCGALLARADSIDRGVSNNGQPQQRSVRFLADLPTFPPRLRPPSPRRTRQSVQRSQFGRGRTGFITLTKLRRAQTDIDRSGVDHFRYRPDIQHSGSVSIMSSRNHDVEDNRTWTICPESRPLKQTVSPTDTGDAVSPVQRIRSLSEPPDPSLFLPDQEVLARSARTSYESIKVPLQDSTTDIFDKDYSISTVSMRPPPLQIRKKNIRSSYMSPLSPTSFYPDDEVDDMQHNTTTNVFKIEDEKRVSNFKAFRKPSVFHGPSVLRKASIAIASTARKLLPPKRRSSVWKTYEKARVRQRELQRSKSFMILFQMTVHLFLVAFVYLVLVGRPLWGGTVWYIYLLFDRDLTFAGGSAIFVGLAFVYAFFPLLVLFENPAPSPFDAFTSYTPALASCDLIHSESDESLSTKLAKTEDCALLIPCYKSASILSATLDAALKIFPKESIFIIANGNSPTPLDGTEDVCDAYGVNHVWSPIGSKIVAQYVGCYVCKNYSYVLLIDDDCALPANFPVVTERLTNKIKVLGYTIKSVGSKGSKGNYCQQAQDFEYKLSGLQRQFAGKMGSATFPHGAISLWDREFLTETFQEHPGFSVSEDWFFGHVARILGSRIVMCTSIFVETETPSSVFFASRGVARGGFGEMTVFKQRFKRWNFFFVNGMYYNLVYIICHWKLGWHEFGTKLFVFQEVYETFLYLITPIVFPISFIVRPMYTLYLFLGTFGMYLVNAVMFNEIHLRAVDQKVNRWMLVTYYMAFKIALTFVNVMSCWWSIWQYASYFAQRHPKIIEDEEAVGIVLRIEEAENERLSSDHQRSKSPDGHDTETNRDNTKEETAKYDDEAWPLPNPSPDDNNKNNRYNRRHHNHHSLTNTPTLGRRMTITAMKVEILPEKSDSTSIIGLDLENNKNNKNNGNSNNTITRFSIINTPTIPNLNSNQRPNRTSAHSSVYSTPEPNYFFSSPPLQTSRFDFVTTTPTITAAAGIEPGTGTGILADISEENEEIEDIKEQEDNEENEINQDNDVGDGDGSDVDYHAM